jgi:hypothetical protein
MQKPEDPMECPNCGGVYFQEAEFRQYYKQTYSSSVGGELHAVSDADDKGPRVRVCLCGHLIPIAALSVKRENRENFAESLEKAMHYRRMLDPAELETRILQIYANKQDATELKHKLAHLLEIVGGSDYQDSHSAADSKSKQKNPAPDERKSGRDRTIAGSKQKKP